MGGPRTFPRACASISCLCSAEASCTVKLASGLSVMTSTRSFAQSLRRNRSIGDSLIVSSFIAVIITFHLFPDHSPPKTQTSADILQIISMADKQGNENSSARDVNLYG